MQPCEIIYVKERSATGWKWRLLDESAETRACEETYQLFYDCVAAARAKGYKPNVKCL